MKLRAGIKLLEEREGEEEPAGRGDRVIYNLKIHLNKGQQVPLNERQAQYLPDELIRRVDGHCFIDHRSRLGSRDTIAGIEYSLIGMKRGGYRKVRLSPHLAYGDQGLADLIPPKAVLIVELWLREIIA
jgi:hypothetical protein